MSVVRVLVSADAVAVVVVVDAVVVVVVVVAVVAVAAVVDAAVAERSPAGTDIGVGLVPSRTH